MEQNIEEPYYDFQNINWTGATALADPDMVTDLLRATAKIAQSLEAPLSIGNASMEAIWQEVQVALDNLEIVQITGPDAKRIRANLGRIESAIGQRRETSQRATSSSSMENGRVASEEHRDETA